MKIEENVSLRELTTFKIGGKARYFCRVKNEDDLIEALAFARSKKIPFVILGGGSNVLVHDKGFAGLVIKMEILGIDWRVSLSRQGLDKVKVAVGSGENWDDFVRLTVEKGLYGMENLSGIPGSVGAAPVQNIGAYGVEIKSVIESVEVFNTKTKKIEKLSNKECQFEYRDSIFKKPEGKKYIILRVTFLLHKEGKLHTGYKDLKNYFQSTSQPATLQVVRKAVLEIRSRKFPDLRKTGTAGSFFKNPIISKEHYEQLKKQWPDLPSFPLVASSSNLEAIKIPLAWILDNICGMKGHRQGDAGLHGAQPIVVVNQGNATAEEIWKLAEHVKKLVKEKTGIDIEWEVQKIQ